MPFRGKNLEDKYRMLNKKCKISIRLANILEYCILLAILVSIWILIDDERVTDIVKPLTYIVAVIAAIHIILNAEIFYRRYKYILTSEKVDVRRGVIIQRHITVPIERIHQVEVVRGPINNMLGLGDVIITTAGGSARIEYLEISEADRISEELNQYVNKIVRDRRKDE